MCMMTTQNLKFVDSPKSQKSNFLDNKTLFLLQIKKLINNAFGVIIW